jgi:hypothetical protein
MITEGHTDKDIEDIFGNLRRHDYQESLILYPDSDPDVLVIHSLDVSEYTFTFRESSEGSCLGVGGVHNHPDVVGYVVWFVGHKDIDDTSIKKLLWSDAKSFIKVLRNKFLRLSNFCAYDPGQLRMLTKLGFTVFETNVPYLRFFQCVS